MKVNGKFAALAGAALLLGSAAFAQESYDGATADYELPEGFSFSYTLSSDIVKAHNISSTDNDFDTYEWWSEFGGLVNKFEVKYNSNLLAFQLAPKVKIGEPSTYGFWGPSYGDAPVYTTGAIGGAPSNVTGTRASNHFSPKRTLLNEDDTGFGYDGLDWNFRFTPFDIVDFYLNDGVAIAGGGLPIGGGRFDAAKLGSDGLTIVLKPIQGLRLAASLPFSLKTFSTWDMLNAEDEDNPAVTVTTIGNSRGYLAVPGDANRVAFAGNGSSPIKFQVKLGADYNFKNLFSIGATWNDVLDASNMQVGVYANITAIQGLDAGIGYTFNRKAQGQGLAFDFFGLNDANGDMFKLYGQHVVQLYAQYLLMNKLSIGAEAAFNFFSEQSLYDMYFGAKVGYHISPKVNIGIAATFGFDFGTQLSYTDSDNNKVSPVTGYTGAVNWGGNASKVKDEAFKDSYLKNKGYANAAWLYRYANADWKRANNYRNDDGVNSNRGYLGEGTDWSGYQAATLISVKPTITYTTGKNVFSGAVAVDYLTTAANDPAVESSDTNSVGDWFFKFPVSWTYNF